MDLTGFSFLSSSVSVSVCVKTIEEYEIHYMRYRFKLRLHKQHAVDVNSWLLFGDVMRNRATITVRKEWLNGAFMMR